MAHSNKEVAFMWSICHIVVVVNEWRARIALASISKQCVFASLTRANWLNISFGIAFKRGQLKIV